MYYTLGKSLLLRDGKKQNAGASINELAYYDVLFDDFLSQLVIWPEVIGDIPHQPVPGFIISGLRDSSYRKPTVW